MANKRIMELRPSTRVQSYAVFAVMIGLFVVAGGKSLAWAVPCGLFGGLAYGLLMEMYYRRRDPDLVIPRVRFRILLYAVVSVVMLKIGMESDRPMPVLVGIAVLTGLGFGLWGEWFYRRAVVS